MDKQRQSQVQTLFFPLLIICTVGLLMIFDSSSGEILDLASGKNQFSALIRQLIWGVCACIASFISWKIGWKRLLSFSPYLYWVLIGMLCLVLIPGIGICANGARRWIGWHGFVFQPSEFIKIILPAYFIYVCIKRPLIFSSLPNFLLLLSQVGLAVLLIAIEPNKGTAGIIILLISVLTCIVGIPYRFFLLPLGCIFFVLTVFAANSTYIQQRVESYLHPEKDLRGKGHQPYQAKIATGSGGIFGKGPAKSMQKFHYLPEAQNDYIAAIFAEEYGFLGITGLLTMYLWLFLELWKIIKSACPEAFCWGAALYFLLVFQTFMNLGVVSGLLPSTGLNLPFFSQGGSSLVANAINIGIIMSIKGNSSPCNIPSL